MRYASFSFALTRSFFEIFHLSSFPRLPSLLPVVMCEREGGGQSLLQKRETEV